MMEVAMLEGFVDFEISLEHGHIYVLLQKDVVVYVGQTIEIHNRLKAHRKNFRFDRALVKSVPRERLLIEEARYITELKPVLNVRIPLVNEIPDVDENLIAALDKLSYDPDRAKRNRVSIRRKRK